LFRSLVVPLGPVIVAPPVQAQRDLLVRVDGLATTGLTAGAAAGAGSQRQCHGARRTKEWEEPARRSPGRGGGRQCHLHSLSARPVGTVHPAADLGDPAKWNDSVLNRSNFGRQTRDMQTRTPFAARAGPWSAMPGPASAPPGDHNDGGPSLARAGPPSWWFRAPLRTTSINIGHGCPVLSDLAAAGAGPAAGPGLSPRSPRSPRSRSTRHR